MNQNNNYTKIFFVLSIIGLILVLFVYLTFAPKKIAVADMSVDMLNYVVAVEGVATKIVKSKFNREFHDNTFCLCMRNETRAHFTLTDENSEIVVYLRNSDLYVPSSGEKVNVVGIVNYWYGVVLFAERVEKVKNNA